ncbi:helicase protein [Ancylostoma caninum]|uniref:RNA helicase n=1 Tax=Ancylostoma caninum TaxID=29170 RepID=A0A368GN78_ANCCA|nr:helicase protein [Ancylostoma caninum]
MPEYHPGHGHRERENDPRNRFKFMRPDDRPDKVRTGPLVFEDRLAEPSGSTQDVLTVYNNPYASLNMKQQRARLPIYKNRDHVLYLCEQFRTVIIIGETGCGKSTQVPQYLLEAGWANDGRMIGVTQPRRVAVVTLASRVAEEKETILGQDVGYTVRFDDVTDDRTKIKFMTDGILLRELLTDPLLSKYSVIMIDEAHERTCNSDILLGLLRKILIVRPDLRIIVSSATLDAELFRDFFELNETDDRSRDTACIMSVEGRTHPVAVYHTKTAVPNYIKATVDTVLEIHKKEIPGDILVFLTGQEEVIEVCEMLSDGMERLRNVDKLWIVPCYGALPPRDQLKAFDSTPHGTRKVVVATNIAEASVTIPGIAYVVDCGFVKLRAMNPDNGIETLMRLPISKASAEQRAGRAGRIRPGKAYRLYPESQYEKLGEGTIPEIQRCHLAPVVLQLKALGIQNVHRFHYLSRPPSWSMINALELLYALGALDEKSMLTNPLGLRMSEFPLPPMHSKCLLTSGEFGCSEEIATIIAMLQVQDVFTAPTRNRHNAEEIKRRFAAEEGDHIALLNVYTMFVKNNKSRKWCTDHYLNYRGLCRADNVRAQLVRLLRRFDVPLVSTRGETGATMKILRCLVSGFFSQAARVIFTEAMQDSIRDISVIEPHWLYELAPHYYEFGTDSEVARKRARES